MQPIIDTSTEELYANYNAFLKAIIPVLQRREYRAPAISASGQALIDDIVAGKLDEHLDALQKAIELKNF